MQIVYGMFISVITYKKIRNLDLNLVIFLNYTVFQKT